MTLTASVCRHDVSAQSTLTLTIPLGSQQCGLSWLTCSVCRHHRAVDVEVHELSSLSVATIRSASRWFDSPEAAPSNCSATDSSSSSPAPTRRASDTNGPADCPTSSPESAPSFWGERSQLWQAALASPEQFLILWWGEERTVQMKSVRELTRRMTLHGGLARLVRYADGLTCAASLAELEAVVRR